MNPFSERCSGILLHPTSLPGPHGVGDLGPQAFRFVEFLARAGQRYWQMLPVGPLGAGASPYDSPSAFAGSPLLISLEALVSRGLLQPSEVVDPWRIRSARNARYPAAIRYRERRLRIAFGRFQARHRRRRARELLSSLAKSALAAGLCAVSRAESCTRRRAVDHLAERAQKARGRALERARRELANEVRITSFCSSNLRVSGRR